MFRGSYTAIITPFRDGAIDWPAFDRLVEWQIEEGTHGLVVCGTTGEAPVLDAEEHMSIVKRAVGVVKGRIPVIAGTGSNSTQKTVAQTEQAKHLGADAALVVAPYYNKPTQEGLYQHYRTVAGAVNIPVIIYNIPGRCVVDILPETIGRLAEIPNIIGVKDATADMSRIKRIHEAGGARLTQLSGEDVTAVSFMEQGGHGCISVVSNVAPALCAQMQNAALRGDMAKAREISEILKPLVTALFSETSPQPVKYAASRLGFCTDEMRLPLLPASAAARAKVDAAMAGLSLTAADAERKTA
jgi:4-hydroxy-tetrahydrodipicolinate synthase